MSRRIVIDAADGTEFRMCMLALEKYAMEHTAGQVVALDGLVPAREYDFNTMTVCIRPGKGKLSVGVRHAD